MYSKQTYSAQIENKLEEGCKSVKKNANNYRYILFKCLINI